MISDAINKIVELAKPIEFTVDGRQYSSKALRPITEPVPDKLVISTLTGLKDYYDRNPDGLDLSTLIFRISSHDKVSLLGPLFGSFERRKVYLEAQFISEDFPYGSFIDPESFIIKLQAIFQQDDTTAKLLAIVGNIKDEKVMNVGDDGITQQVVARAGIAKVENVNLPNPITLTPYRTFLEADQPLSQFVFRMRSGAAEKSVSCALFEADGGRWKLDAIQNIKKWLHLNVSADIQVLA